MSMEFKVLGGLDVVVDEIDCAPSAPKVRQVLALLLAKVGRGVPADTIISELWHDCPPVSAATTTQTYIYQLRKMLSEHGITGSRGEALATRGNGYCLALAPENVDEHCFRERVAEGKRLMDAEDYRGASAVLESALSMWEGSPFSGVDMGRVLEAHAVNLEEIRNRAIEMRIEAQMELGEYHELVGELRLLLAEQPLNEWMHGKLIQALGRVGRRADALLAYQQMRDLLDEELGLSPSAESRRLQAEVLSA
ncbi:AfsR/SARP family transcriptional regulator [Actinomycetes bacterium M1A6_2h]